MVNNLINFLIAISFLLPELFVLAFDLSQLLQLDPHIINTNFIMFLIAGVDSKDILEIPELWHSIGSADKDLLLRWEN